MKNLKSLLLLPLMMLVPTTGLAQNNEPPPPPRGTIVFKLENDKLEAEEVFILAVTAGNIAYKYNAGDAEPEVKKMAEVDSVFLYDPADYLEALDLFEGRKYAAAKDAFAKVKEKYGKRYPGIPNNPGTLAAYYELECLRKLFDLEGLRVALQAFDKSNLTRKVPLQQLEIYVLWDAIRANLNQEALKIAEGYKDKRLPGHQRAQVAYCLGRALEGLNKPSSEILLAYQTALTADAGNSEVIARDAALRSLEILNNDEEVKMAIKTFKESEGKELVRGFTKAMEAAGLCSMFRIQLGAGEPLPAKYRHFLDYTPEKVQALAEGGGDDKPKEKDDKKEDKKDDEKKEGE